MMAEKDLEAKDKEKKVHDLAGAMEEVRSSQADKDDVVVDMKHAKVSRLELLAGDLQEVFNDAKEKSDQFEFAISHGNTPRLWIDVTSFVRLGADGREYEFVKDTRLGRVILANSADREQIGKRITGYIAERILERERIVEGDWVSLMEKSGELAIVSGDRARSGGLRLAIYGAWFLLGAAAGLVGLLLAYQNGIAQPFFDWLFQNSP